MRQQIRKHVVAMLVPSTGGRTRGAAEHNLERRVRRIAGEIFIGINVKVGGMIDGEQLHLVEVNGLFQRLHEAETQLAIFFAERSTVKLDGFGRPSNISSTPPFPRRDPVPDDPCAEHTPDGLKARAAPRKERGPRT